MALRLRVVSEQRRALGDRASIVVGVGGMSIGRSADNDWVLPDPHRYMSGRHARIHFRQGAYYLEDTSTNGIFLNDSDLPVSRQGLYCLRNGDLLRLGEYQVIVTFEALAASAPPAEAAAPLPPAIPPPPATPPRPAAAPAARAREPVRVEPLEVAPAVTPDPTPDSEFDSMLRRAAAPLPSSAPDPLPALVPAPAPVPPPAPVPLPGTLPAALSTGESVIVRAAESIENTGRSGHTDLGASLNLQALLDASPSDHFRAVNAFGQAVARPRADRDVEPEADSDAVARRLARLSRAVSRTRAQSNAPAFYDVQTGLNAFCRGAGIDPSRLPVDAQTRMLHLAGQLFRESLVGLRDLHRFHHEFRNRLRIEMRREDDPNRPSLTRGGVEELAEALLQSHDSRRIDAVQWLRAAFEDAKEHDSASSSATQAAFAEFILRLEPGDLESRFARAAKRGRAGPEKAEYWDLYSEFYRNLCDMPPDGLPHVFVEAFARAYLELFRQDDPP